MSAPLTDLADVFAFHDRALHKLVDGFEESDWLHRLGGETSNAYWLLGHMTVYRRLMLRCLGDTVEEEPWAAGFGYGSSPPEAIGTPGPQRLRRVFATVGGRIVERMRALGPDEAEAGCGREFPNGARTVAGAAHFLSFHESYHIGQIGMLARALGGPGLG
jgi:hypothetical protein